MKIGNIINEGLEYHIENKIPLHENIYRLGTDKYFETFTEARRLYQEGKLSDLHEWDEEILRDTQLGEWANIKGVGRVPLDMPISEEEHNRFIAEKSNEEDDVLKGFDPKTAYAIKKLQAKYPHADNILSALLADVEKNELDSDTADHEIEDRITDLEKKVEDLLSKGELKETDDDGLYGIIRYPDTAISYVVNNGDGWKHLYDPSYGFSGDVDYDDLDYLEIIDKDDVPQRLTIDDYYHEEVNRLRKLSGLNELNADMFKQGADSANKLAKSAVDMHSKADAAMANSPFAKTKQYKDYQKTNMDNKKAAMKQGMPYGRQDIDESEERDYICVHAKKGKYECSATSSYGAAKKAAEHWKLKSTAGIDAYLADVKHTVTESDNELEYNGKLHKSVDYTVEHDDPSFCYDCKLVSTTHGEIDTEHDEADVVCPRCGSQAYVEASPEEMDKYSSPEAWMSEAEYQGKKVELNKPKRGGSKKFYVYTRNPKTGKIKKVAFGAAGGGGNLAVKLRDPKARKAFADRHNCDQKNDKTKPGYWSCRLPRYAKSLGLSGGGTWW